MVEFLINQECRRRGIDPKETLAVRRLLNFGVSKSAKRDIGGGLFWVFEYAYGYDRALLLSGTIILETDGSTIVMDSSKVDYQSFLPAPLTPLVAWRYDALQVLEGNGSLEINTSTVGWAVSFVVWEISMMPEGGAPC